jgi:hypothetical protein
MTAGGVMDMNETDKMNTMRRKFLLLAGCAPAIGVAALIGRSPEIDAAPVNAPAADPPVSSGYHETEHIRKYYYCARYF